MDDDPQPPPEDRRAAWRVAAQDRQAGAQDVGPRGAAQRRQPLDGVEARAPELGQEAVQRGVVG